MGQNISMFHDMLICKSDSYSYLISLELTVSLDIA